jgi:outer membrane lipoprotein SlyB
MFRITIVACALALTACATTADTQTAQQPRQEREYRVGSNIPVRDPVASSPTTTANPSVLNQPSPGRAPTL